MSEVRPLRYQSSEVSGINLSPEAIQHYVNGVELLAPRRDDDWLFSAHCILVASQGLLHGWIRAQYPVEIRDLEDRAGLIGGPGDA